MSEPKEYKITITVKEMHFDVEVNDELEKNPHFTDHLLQTAAAMFHGRLLQETMPKIQFPAGGKFPGRMN